MSKEEVYVIIAGVVVLGIVIFLIIHITKPKPLPIPHNCPSCGNSLDVRDSTFITFAPPILLENGKEKKREIEFCAECLTPKVRLNRGNIESNLRDLFLYEESEINLIINSVKEIKNQKQS